MFTSVSLRLTALCVRVGGSAAVSGPILCVGVTAAVTAHFLCVDGIATVTAPFVCFGGCATVTVRCRWHCGCNGTEYFVSVAMRL